MGVARGAGGQCGAVDRCRRDAVGHAPLAAVMVLRPAESGHWYNRLGEPAYFVESAKGAQRPTTLADARKLNLLPSVTTILAAAARPGLEAWKQQQLLLAALTLPPREGESLDAFAERAIADARRQSNDARDRGTEIHARVQQGFEGGPGNESYLEVKRALDGAFGTQPWVSEKSFAHKLGYGGKVDLHCPKFVVDIKTKPFEKGDDIQPFDDNLMQLAAYRVGLGFEHANCANVFVSTAVSGLVTIHHWRPSDLERGWQMFEALLNFWYAKTGLTR